MQKGPKILLYDLETAPNLAYVWAKYETNVIEFVKEWELLCFSFKWLGEDKITCYTRNHFKDKTDKALTKKLWQVLDSAQVVIAHNGNSFDVKRSNAKFIEHGLPPVTPFQQIDTKLLAKSKFAFNSNSLDDLGRLLGVGRKLKKGMDFSIWLGCMQGDPAAFKVMSEYNKQDVALLERVYLKLRPWAESHPNVARIADKPQGCPKCSSEDFIAKGLRFGPRSTWRQYQCKSCSGYFKGETVKAGAKT